MRPEDSWLEILADARFDAEREDRGREPAVEKDVVVLD